MFKQIFCKHKYEYYYTDKYFPFMAVSEWDKYCYICHKCKKTTAIGARTSCGGSIIMEYSTYLIAKSLQEEMDRVESQIKAQQYIIDNADHYMKNSGDEKVLKNAVHELHGYLAELKVEFWNL